MPIISLNDISGGIRKLGQRTFPQNAVKDCLNIIPNIDNSIFVTEDNISLKFNAGNILPIISAIVVDIDGTDTIFYAQLDESINTIYIKQFNGAEDDPNSVAESYVVGSGKNPLNLIKLIGGFISHNSSTIVMEDYIRRFYIDGDYPKFNNAVGGSEGWGFYPIPGLVFNGSASYSILWSDIYLSSSIAGADDLPPIISLTDPDNSAYLRIGLRFDGFQSIVKKIGSLNLAAPLYPGGSSDTECVFMAHIELKNYYVSNLLSDRVTGIDFYVARSGELQSSWNLNEEDLDWYYIDCILFDQNMLLAEISGLTITSTTNTIATGQTYATNQFRGCSVIIDPNSIAEEILITSNTIGGVLTLDSNIVANGTYGIEIRAKWVQDSDDDWHCSKFLGSLSGESLIYRTGVSPLKIENVEDYCPPANIIEYFKGRVWLADYYEYGTIRRKNRLIYNVINSDGLSCKDVYNVEKYIEFTTPIYFLKASSDYMLVFTADGVYSIRFLPSTESYSVNWTIKKVSDNIIIRNKNLCWESKALTFVFDGSTIYVFDGNFFKSATGDEHSNFLREYVTTSNMTDFDYSMFFSEADDSVILMLDKCIRFKDGIFKYDFTYDPLDRSIVVNGRYNGRNLFFNGRRCYQISEFDDIGDVYSFNIETLKNDLGSKSEKYLNSVYIEYEKTGVDVYVYIYIDNVLLTGGTITLSPSLISGIREVFPPKSRSRRFTNIRYRIEGVDGTLTQFKLKAFDVDIDPIGQRRRRGLTNG